jgi:hypothetical protein
MGQGLRGFMYVHSVNNKCKISTVRNKEILEILTSYYISLARLPVSAETNESPGFT